MNRPVRNEARAERCALLLPERVTPHTLRRMFASLCFFAGCDPRFVMSRLGHADARRVCPGDGAPRRRP
ncbi:tyrosine-type recombinase/integrase [Baekduia soli]|uniref:Tyrosine-type recombinase/integrase n=1 Tax=Baekduia soli TaxID=496014 RepID=A0A5B8UCD9_9ACTN|nr:tyrosine-type recombinase/integrase [Baekduia soli]